MRTVLGMFFMLCLSTHPTRVDQSWVKITAPLTVEFPRDHGAHLEYQTEWWYATGTLQDATDGARFGWQLTVFRRGVQPGPAPAGDSMLVPRHVFAGHFALVDVAAGRTIHAERLRRGVPELASAATDALTVKLEGWSFVLDDNGILHAYARDRENGSALDLELRPTKPAVLHGRENVSQKGANVGDASAYMSWTRLTTRGTITIEGRERAVSGESWFDHEWGSSQLGEGVIGWDWFGLRLDDGRELMLYRLRRSDGTVVPQSSGTLVALDGSARHLELNEFTLETLESWTGPVSGARYDTVWRVRVPTAGIDVTLRPWTPDCEIDARASTGTVYWEGPVAVTGSVSGTGYGELTGYAGSLAAKF